MSKYATTEITSAEIPSDNPVHQRLYFPYVEAAKIIHGNVLELGCGWGRGVETLIEKCDHYTGLDKNQPLIDQLQAAYPKHTFSTADLPHLSAFKDNTFDYVVTFQVIEHIQDDHKVFVRNCSCTETKWTSFAHNCKSSLFVEPQSVAYS